MRNYYMILVQNTGKILAAMSGLVIFLAAAGCGAGEPSNQSANFPPDSPVARIPEIKIHPDDPSPIVGMWEVVDFHLTPVSAIAEDVAIEWLGQLIVFSENAVGFETELCDTPSFEESSEVFVEYFSVYGVKPEIFGVTEDEVDVINVRCDSAVWSGVGSELFRVVGDTIVVVYDGIFLSLEPF